jgi:hypothetical protein
MKTNPDRRQSRRSRWDWVEEAKEAFMKAQPGWRGTSGEQALVTALNALLASGRLTVASSPRSAVKELANLLLTT